MRLYFLLLYFVCLLHELGSFYVVVFFREGVTPWITVHTKYQLWFGAVALGWVEIEVFSDLQRHIIMWRNSDAAVQYYMGDVSAKFLLTLSSSYDCVSTSQLPKPKHCHRRNVTSHHFHIFDFWFFCFYRKLFSWQYEFFSLDNFHQGHALVSWFNMDTVQRTQYFLINVPLLCDIFESQ